MLFDVNVYVSRKKMCESCAFGLFTDSDVVFMAVAASLDQQHDMFGAMFYGGGCAASQLLQPRPGDASVRGMPIDVIEKTGLPSPSRLPRPPPLASAPCRPSCARARSRAIAPARFCTWGGNGQYSIIEIAEHRIDMCHAADELCVNDFTLERVLIFEEMIW